MATFRFGTHIEAPPERVFELWTDLDRMPEWIGGLTAVTDRTGPVDQKGTTYISRFGSRASPTEVLAVERPRFIRTRFGTSKLNGETEARFDPEGTGTRISLTLTTRGAVSSIAAWVFSKGSWRGSFKGELEHFGQIVERG